MFVISPVAKVFPSVRLSRLRLSASIELLSNVSLKLNDLLCLELFYFYSSVCGKPYETKVHNSLGLYQPLQLLFHYSPSYITSNHVFDIYL